MIHFLLRLFSYYEFEYECVRVKLFEVTYYVIHSQTQNTFTHFTRVSNRCALNHSRTHCRYLKWIAFKWSKWNSLVNELTLVVRHRQIHSIHLLPILIVFLYLYFFAYWLPAVAHTQITYIHFQFIVSRSQSFLNYFCAP